MTDLTTQTETPRDAAGRVEGILEAACRVIARDGAHGLHMKTVAREAGVSKALVHYYVQTRQELLRQALAYADERTRTQLEAELVELATGRERLERLLVAYASNEPVFEQSHALSSAAWGSLMLDEELAPAVRAAYQRWSAWIASMVEEGRADGSLPGVRDVAESAVALTALAEGLSSLIDTEVIDAGAAVEQVRAAVGELARGARR